ncbi:MAG: M55 family metallopeptidase [Fimbriimonadaceae bacterium]
MNIYISADMEGITGQVTWKACGAPSAEHYDFAFARRMMTHDVNAAIRGARRAGATRIVVKDSHGTSRNLLIDDLEPGVELISGEGAGADGMMHGIGDGFDAALLVGYHGMAGTDRGVMEHTITGGVHRIWLGDREVGEMALSALACGIYGVPIVMVSSDDAGCREGSAFFEGCATAVTKVGYGRYMARCLHPTETAPIIERAAMEGIDRRATVGRYLPTSLVGKIEFNRQEEADFACRMPGASKLDAYTVRFEGDSLENLHRGMRMLMALGMNAR